MLEKPELEKIATMIRNEIGNSDLAKKLQELDSKIIELRKTLESVLMEILYIKSELNELRDKETSKKFEKTSKLENRAEKSEKIEQKKGEEVLDKAEKFASEDDLIICD